MTRSEIMASIPGKNTSIELSTRRYLFSKGFRYRINVKSLPGKPDIVLRKYRTAIFVNGCFWHGHTDCKLSRMPKTNCDYWNAKITSNIERDELNYTKLKKLGWKVIVLWECEIKKFGNERFDKLIEQIRESGDTLHA